MGSYAMNSTESDMLDDGARCPVNPGIGETSISNNRVAWRRFEMMHVGMMH